MDKRVLLETTQSLIREAVPQTDDLLLQSGLHQIQKNVLNYYREDLDEYPLHSARAIVKMANSMLRFVGIWGYDELTRAWPMYQNLRILRDLWSNEIRR